MTDLTNGRISTVLPRFTAPLFISVVFQQLYSIADSLIAGRFVGEEALAAVGASFPVTNIFNAVAFGCNIGCGVVISQFFGAREYKRVRTATSTSLLSFTALAVILTALGIVFTPFIMRAIETPENIFADSALYLKIYLGGFAFLFIYNVSNAIFNAMGDSKTSLYFLIFSSVFNVILDYIFVVFFSMGVAGVAWATFIAQGIAGIFSMLTLLHHLRRLPQEGKAPLFSGSMLSKISKISVPSILQQSFVSVGNIFVQSLINSFGSSVIAGFSAAMKMNTFTITSLCTVGNGVSSFTAQNIGAGKTERISGGYKCGVLLGAIIGIVFGTVYFAFAKQLMGVFIENGAGGLAVEAGASFLRIVAPFYAFISVKIVADGILRGAGNMKFFMTATFADLILRVVLSFILAPKMGYRGIWASWPVGWLMATVLSFIFYGITIKRAKSGKLKRL